MTQLCEQNNSLVDDGMLAFSIGLLREALCLSCCLCEAEKVKKEINRRVRTAFRLSILLEFKVFLEDHNKAPSNLILMFFVENEEFSKQQLYKKYQNGVSVFQLP